MSKRTEGAILVGRKDNEYWFVDSVFWHDANFYGCTGSIVCPISEEQAEDELSVDQLEDRFYDYWYERAIEDIQEGCENCAGEPNNDGCEDCGYQSLRRFCEDIVRYDGYDAVFDYPGHAYEEVLRDLLVSDDDPSRVETVDHSGCGRIFGNDGVDDFDEVYNLAALEACLAYEKGIGSYDDTARVIFGTTRATCNIVPSV